MLAINQILQGRYRIIRQLGAGGMGAVYKARQKSLGRMVALKILAPQHAANPDFAERFAREAKVLAEVSHPNIVTVHDFGQAGEAETFYFLTMEFVDGVNLRQAMTAGRLTPPQALAIVPPICEALQFAHDRGIVHRDIKPENILLTRKGVAKVVDFGLAQLTQGGDLRLTQAGMTMGTPLYMSPEQVQGLKVDQRSDLYSLGATIFHLLAGRPPFQGESALAVAYHQVHTPPPSLLDSRPDVSSSLNRVIQRMLAKKCDERFPSAQALLEELRDLDKRGESAVDLAMPIEPATEQMAQPVPSFWVEWRSWLSPFSHPWAAFVFWGLVLITTFAAIGRRSARPSAAMANPPGGKLSRVERQPTIARQLEVARKSESDDAWWAVLLYFEGDAPEKHLARQELIPRMFHQQRFAEAERLCGEVLAAKNAPESAVATAWAGRALHLTLQGRIADAERIEQQHVRAHEKEIQRPLGAWLDESLRRRRGPSPSTRGSEETERNRRRL